MAAPHVAGVMALLKGANPDWSVEELRALAMNTAGHDLYTGLGQTGDKYGVARVGAGRVDVPAALGSKVVAYDANGEGAVSVSFGAVEVLGQHQEEREVTVVNHGSSARTFAKSLDLRTNIPGVEFSLPGNDEVNVPAGGSATFRVRLTADASQMQNTRDATVAGSQLGLPRHWLSEEGGLIILTPEGGGAALRVPVYATARPATKMGASGNTLTFRGNNATSQTIHLSGQDVSTGAELLGWVSKVSAFELEGPLPPDVAERVDSSLEEARLLGEDQGVEVRTDVVRSRSIGHAIVAEAGARSADLIVLGSAARWRRQSRFFSPTVDFVLRRAPCEVLVVAFPDGVFEE